MRQGKIIIIGLGFLLSSCISYNIKNPTQFENSKTVSNDCLKTVETATNCVNNKTHKFYDEGHTTQVEYINDGEAFLWYPGNGIILKSKVKFEDSATGPRICFLYGKNTMNFITGSRGGDWNCRAVSSFFRNHTDYLEGDPLELSDKKLPYILEKGEWSFEQIANMDAKRETNFWTKPLF